MTSIYYFALYYDIGIKSEFCHSLKYSNCYIATQFSQFSNTSNFHKMLYSQHFITFLVFGVSTSLKCLLVQAQSHFGLLTLTSYNNLIGVACKLIFTMLHLNLLNDTIFNISTTNIRGYKYL